MASDPGRVPSGLVDALEPNEQYHTITVGAVDRITDRAFEFGWKAALQLVEDEVKHGTDSGPPSLGAKTERSRILEIIAGVRSRYADR